MTSILNSTYWPFFVLGLSILLVVILITKLKFHPFIALVVSAIVVGLLSPDIPLLSGQSRLVTALELPMVELGVMVGRIAWIIAMAALIGISMMESGAAEQIVNGLIRSLGESRAAVVLLICGYLLSTPIFFDTMFFLLIPLGIALARRTGKDFVLYVIVIAGGAIINHSIVPPTPGPLIMAETLSLDLGMTIVSGIIAGLLPAGLVYIVGKWMNAKLPIPLRVDAVRTDGHYTPPGFLLSVLPIALPVFLISMASAVQVIVGYLPSWLAILGNRNTAMAASAFISLILWAKARNLSPEKLWDRVHKPLEMAGIIILITGAGGAYGAMIGHSGIGKAIQTISEGLNVHYIVLAWLIAAVFKTAQGSGTVSMISSSAIMVTILQTGVELDFHPIYLFLAMGFGSIFISWMNDSAFWVVARMSGFTERETLKTWTLLMAIIGVFGLLEVMLLAWLFPLV